MHWRRSTRTSARKFVDARRRTKRAAGTQMRRAAARFPGNISPRWSAQGLLVRIERAINKDTELHPLVRWQFQGGLAEKSSAARSCSPTWSMRAGRRYDMPVVVGALAASPRIYALGMGRPVEEIETAWTACDRQSDSAGRRVLAALPGGRDQRRRFARRRQRPRAPAGADLDARASTPRPISPRRSASPAIRDTGIQNMGTYRAALKASDRLGVRMASRVGGAGGYLHWRKHNERGEPMPCAIVVGCAPVAMFTGGMKLAVDLDEMAVAGGACRRADPHGEGGHRRSRRAGRCRDRHRGGDRSGAARARGAVRRKSRLCRARRFQHVDAGDRDHAQALAGASPPSSAR